MIELRRVKKSFGPTVAVQEVDLSLEPGRTIVLLGPSGCGKSTLLRLMIGLTRPDAGTVVFEGKELERLSLLEVRRKVGYVIQDGGLFAHLTARANITLMAHYLRWSAARVESRVRELAELAQLPLELLHRYPAELSGGQRQRVALLRALMLDPRVLLLDEPLGALDPMVRFDLQSDLRRIFRQLNKTVVLVTHDLAEAAYLGEQILLMRDGHIVQRGTLRDLTERPADPFVTRFVNAQRMPVDAARNC